MQEYTDIARDHNSKHPPQSGGESFLSGGWLQLRRLVLPFLALSVFLWWIDRSCHAWQRAQVSQCLQAILRANSTILVRWLDEQQARLRACSASAEFDRILTSESSQSKDRSALNDPMNAMLNTDGAECVVLADRHARVAAVAHTDVDPIVRTGQRLPMDLSEHFDGVMQGRTSVAASFRSPFSPGEQPGRTKLFVSTAVADGATPLGMVSICLDASDKLSQILGHVRFGETGKTLVLDAEARILAASRRDLNEDAAEFGAPAGRQPRQPRIAGAWSRSMAAEVARISRLNEEHVTVHTAPFADFRDTSIVAAWQWLPRLQAAIVIQTDSAEAFRPVGRLRTVLWVCWGAILAGTLLQWRAHWLSRDRRRRTLKAGPYTLCEPIGGGRNGHVYRGRHTLLERPAAIKILNASARGKTTSHRFRREAQFASRLHSANTVQIYDYGPTSDGGFFYAMELLDGFDLRQLVEQFGPLPDGRIVQTLVGICQSLREAHACGLIHGDIKPANVMLCNRGGDCDLVKVLDFGVCQPAGTQSETVTGTPAFMAPEVAGSMATANPMSDFYSLGCLSYFLQTGRPPILGSNPIETCWKQLHEAPPPLARESHLTVAEDLQTLTMSCLEKDPSDRPTSAAEILEKLLAIQPVQPWTDVDAANWWRQNARNGKTIGTRALFQLL